MNRTVNTFIHTIHSHTSCYFIRMQMQINDGQPNKHNTYWRSWIYNAIQHKQSNQPLLFVVVELYVKVVKQYRYRHLHHYYNMKIIFDVFQSIQKPPSTTIRTTDYNQINFKIWFWWCWWWFWFHQCFAFSQSW
jgi:hypothetical protein